MFDKAIELQEIMPEPVMNDGFHEEKQLKSKNGFHQNKQLKKQETETSISEAEFNKDGLKYKSKPKKFSGCDQFYFNLSAFALMIWDGVGFFGTDHFKLLRLQGEKVNFCTPFKSIK